MKRFLIGITFGLVLGWLTVPICGAISHHHYGTPLLTDEQVEEVEENVDLSHTYKWYLAQILKTVREANTHLQEIELNTKAVKDKLHA